MGKIWPPPEAVGVKDAQGVAVGKMWRPRRPAKAPLKAVGVKDAQGVAVIAVDGEVEASVLGAPVVAVARGGEKEPLEDGTAVCLMDSPDGAPVIATTRQEVVGVKDAQGVAVGKMWRPRRPANAPLKPVGVKHAKGVTVNAVDGKVEASVLGAPMVAAARGGEKGPRRPAKAPLKAVGVKHAKGVTVNAVDGKVEASVLGAPVVAAARGGEKGPRRPANAPLKAVGVKHAKGVTVNAVDGKVEASVLGAPVVAAARGGEKGPRRPAKAPLKEVGVKHAKGVTVNAVDGKVEASVLGAPVVTAARGGEKGPRRPANAPLKAVGVKHAKGVTMNAVDGKVEASVLGAPVVAAARGGEKGPLEDGTVVCLMDSLDGAPVIATTRQEAVGVKDAEGVAVGKMWRPRRPAKAPLKAVGAKHAKGVTVNAVDGEVEASILGAPVVAVARGGEKWPLEDGTVVCLMDSLDGAPVIATTRQEAVGVKDAEGVAVGKMWRPRQPAKAPLKAVGVKHAEGVAVITVDGEVEASILGAPVVAEARGGEKGPLEDGTVVCLMDSLDGASVIATTRQEAVGVQDAEGVAVGKMWRPRRLAKAPLEALGVKDAEGVAVITVNGEVEASILRAPVVVAAGGDEKGPLEEGIMVCQVDTLDGAPVIAMTQQEALGLKDTEEVAAGKMWRPRRPAKAPLEAVGVKDAEGVVVIAVDEEVERLVLGVPVVAAAGGGEKGSLEDGIVVCRMDALDGALVIATDEKEEVSVQGDLVFPAVDQKVDAPVVEGVHAITMKGNGKEEKDKEGIKWLKHYSTAQSILIVGDGDFSFSLALATMFGSGGNLVATSLDSYGALTSKYDKAESNVRELKRLGATVLHGVDAKTMKLHSYLEMRRFDRIVFNFPHAGFKGKEDQLHVINAHKQLVHGFLANARQLLRPYGETHLSHKTGFPYDAWDIEQLAYESGLVMVRKVDFSKEDYPGYNQKRGDGPTCDESFPLGPCCTFMFCIGDVEKMKQAQKRRRKKLKQAHGNRVGSISSCLGDSKFYPGISATDIMWPFDLHPAWPQPHFPPVHMPIAFDACPFGVAEMEHPINCYGTSFHHQYMVQPTHQEQPWYQEGPPVEPPWTPQEHQSLQREYQIHRQLTLSLEDRYMESVERQAMLEMLIQVYGRQ